MNRAASYLCAVIKYGLYLILFTPLVLWTPFSDPYATTKVLAFQILVGLVVAATLVLRWLAHSREDRRPEIPYFPEASRVFSALSLFIGFVLVSAAFGKDLHRSFWGIADRQDGLILWLHLWAWLVMITQYFDGRVGASISALSNKGNKRAQPRTSPEKPNLHFYLRFSFWISVAVAFTAVYEWFEKYFGIFWLVPRSAMDYLGERVGGVFGNPIFLGPYLLTHFFYGLYYLGSLSKGNSSPSSETPDRRRSRPIRAASSRRKWLAFAVAVAEGLHVAAILLGITRGVILGLVLGLLLLCFFLIFAKDVSWRLRIPAATVILLLIFSLGSLWLLRRSSLNESTTFIKRLTQISFTQTTSAWTRLLAWKSTFSTFKDHPVLGWGHDNVYYGLSKHYDPEHVREDLSFRESTFTWWDKSHNAYLDLLAEKGLVGVVLYLVLWQCIVRSLWRLSDRFLALCLTCGFVGYLAPNFFAFDSFGSLFGLFLFLAPIILSESSTNTAGKSVSRDAQMRIESRMGIFFRKIRILQSPLMVLLFLLSLLSIYVSIQTAMASAGYAEAQEKFAQNADSGFRAYRKAFDYYSPYRSREKLRCATLIIESVLNKRLSESPSDAIPRALELASEAARAFPDDVLICLTLADIYNNLSIYVDKRYLDKAEAFGKKALDLSPKRQEAAFYLGRTYILRNEASKAVDLNRRMVADSPNFPAAHWFLSLSFIADGQRDEAKRSMKTALALGYRFQNPKEEQIAKDLFGEQGFLELTRVK